MMKALLILSILVMCAVPASAAGMLNAQSLDLTYIGDIDKYGLSLSLKALPYEEPDVLTLATTPQWVASRLTLDVIMVAAEGESNDAYLGISLPMEVVGVENVPVRVGVTKIDGDYRWFIKGAIWTFGEE